MVGTCPSSPRTVDPAAAAAAAQAERETALARAEAAEQEAAAAAQERDAAAQRARDALARAAKERALAAKGTPDADHDAEKEEDAASVDSGGTALHHAVLAHEAAAVVNLHAQAISVQNIRSLVHVLLDINAGNYTRWRDQILLVIGKYSLESHVLVDLPAPDFPDWTRMDCIVKS